MPVHLFPTASSRRDFLKSLALGGAALAAGRPLRADDDEGRAGGWFALVSDTHIAADPATRNREQNMAENLGVVVSQIVAEPEPPAGVVIDGDLALKDGQTGDYRTFLNLLEPVRRAGVPIHLTLGNHDDRASFRTILGDVAPDSAVMGKQVSQIDILGLRMMFLDSLDVVNVTPGWLGERQLKWLGDQLDARPNPPTLVFLHHNPDPLGLRGLRDTAVLLGVLGPRKQVKAFIFGHTHVWESYAIDDGLHRVNLPAVGYPFAADQPIGWVKFRPTGPGAELELRAVGGDRSKHGQKVPLTWRKA